MTTADTARRRAEVGAGSAVGDVLAGALANAPAPDDDAAWAKRDAEIQAAKERAAADEVRKALEVRAHAFGHDLDFPERAIATALDPEKTAPLEVALGWAPVGRKNILVLSGDQGIGKTVAACAHALRSTYRTWRYVRSSTFQATSRFDRGARDAMVVGGLILDDLGVEYADAKGSFLSDLDELVDFYYSRPSRPLIITTNVSAKPYGNRPGSDFTTRYRSERLLGRLREAAVWREFGGAPCLRPPPGVKESRR